MGNREAKEHICRTHGHELRWGNAGGEGSRVEGNKGEKKQDNYSSIINKIYLKNLRITLAICIKNPDKIFNGIA